MRAEGQGATGGGDATRVQEEHVIGRSSCKARRFGAEGPSPTNPPGR